MKAKSKIVTSNQAGIHKDLKVILSKFDPDLYQRPPSDFSINCLEEIVLWINSRDTSASIILDMCCGVGESSFHLALKNPNCLIVGIDKSEDRLVRNNNFKRDLPENLLLVRGELLDLWYLFATDPSFPKERVSKQYILYPNPWPKACHVKRRWHGNSIAPFIYKLSNEIVLRTNWKIYAEEFLMVSKYFEFTGEVSDYVSCEVTTPFERKYLASGHVIYQLVVQKKSALYKDA